jgi:ankyrin repeat protein
MDSVKAFQKGEVVDQKKLNDMKFEGTYATKAPTAKPAALPAPTVQPIYGADQTVFVPQGPWVTIPRTIGKRCHSAMISQNKNSMVLDILNNTPDIYTQRYQNNANLLMVATSIGRCAIVKAICEAKVFDINEKDNNGRTALDMAALHGYWKTYDVLVGFGATLSVDTELLLRTCLSNRYYNLSTRLVKENKVVVTDDMISAAPTSAVYQWLNKMGQRDIPIDIAIRKGLFETVKTKLDTIDKIALKDCLNIFHGNDPDYFNILELLVNTHKVDPNEIIDIMVDDEKEITWPLFIACEEGKMDFFNLLIPFYRRPEQLNMQNKRGTTVLWIASCNRHIDIVNELLQRGADPNIPNLKGDSALVSCCQKNNSTLAELLLSAGARLDIYNKNRDNPVLICCRTGHAKVLEMLLKTLKPDELKTILNAYAEIDGFVPILASTELDRVDCIRMCVKYGAPLETKTADDNKIIAGATSMHLACHYGRLNAAKTLHELGASLVATTVDGLTPLHVAIQKGHAQVVRFLLTTQGGKDSLHIKDKQGRLPAFYASMLGNEHIKEEFFTDRLALLLEKALHVEPSLEQKCAIVLSKYGRNLHDRLVLDNNTPLMTAAILNNSKYMIDSLTHLGVDVYKKDDFGLSPMFWSAYTGCDIGHEPDPETCELIDRLKVVQKKNLQNKLLLNFSEDTKQLLLEAPKESDNNNFNVTMKMSSNYFTKIKKEVITALEKTQSSQSLLGFLEKLKNNKLVKVDTVMRDAKVHLISLVASGEKVLDPAHLLALYLYTSSMAVFNQVNLAMSEWEKHKIWQPYVMCMYQGLKLLDPFVGEAYRVVDIPFDPFEYKVGTLISWNTFSIASKSWIIASEQINKKKGVIFIIKSKTGRDVSKYSKFTVDQEVMFLPNCVFEVTNLYKPDIVALGQENIRATTFGASEKDLERAGLGQAAIIVDISEKVAMPTVLDV